MNLNRKAILWAVIQKWINIPYHWGGDNPGAGVDCSGFVQELLWSVGLLEDTQDRTAGGQLDYWKRRGRFFDKLPDSTSRVSGVSDTQIVAPQDVFGWLVFFKAVGSERIIHVEILLTRHNNDYLCVGARGDSGVRSMDDAIRKDAFVKVRPLFKNRKNMRFAGCVNPWID